MSSLAFELLRGAVLGGVGSIIVAVALLRLHRRHLRQVFEAKTTIEKVTEALREDLQQAIELLVRVQVALPRSELRTDVEDYLVGNVTRALRSSRP